MGWQTGTSWPGPVSVTGSVEGVVRKDAKRPASHGLADLQDSICLAKKCPRGAGRWRPNQAVAGPEAKVLRDRASTSPLQRHLRLASLTSPTASLPHDESAARNPSPVPLTQLSSSHLTPENGPEEEAEAGWHFRSPQAIVYMVPPKAPPPHDTSTDNEKPHDPLLTDYIHLFPKELGPWKSG